MSVPLQVPIATHVANGVTVSFAYTYKILDSTDMLVYVDGVQVLTGFTVTGVGSDTGGTVEFATAPANTKLVVLFGKPSAQRATNYQQFGDLLSPTLNKDIDRIILMIQSMAYELSLALRVSAEDVQAGFDASLPVPTALQFLRWNDTAQRLENATLVASGSISIPVPVSQGGTNSTTQAGARSSLGVESIADHQGQTNVAGTTSGTSTAYTLDLPSNVTLAAKLRAMVTYHTAPGAAPTLSIDGTTAKLLKYRDAFGTKQTITPLQVPSGWMSPTTYDGTDYVVEQVAAVNNMSRGVRQTVMSGPVDSNGLAAFGGSTGSGTVTAAGTLIVTAANGFNALGPVDRIGSIVNPSWPNLTTNGTMYLGLLVNADGTCASFSATLAPTYQNGGTYSTTNNQRTFNISEMVMKAGNGTTAAQAYEVFVGEVTVSGGVVTAITWYQPNRRYIGPYTQNLPAVATQVSQNHNLGVSVGIKFSFEFENTTTDAGYAVGDIVDNAPSSNASYAHGLNINRTRNTVFLTTGVTAAFLVTHKTTGVLTACTQNSWKYRIVSEASW